MWKSSYISLRPSVEAANCGFHSMEWLGDRDQNEEDFTNGGRGHPPKHLKFFLQVFSKLKKKLNKERIKPKRRLQAFKNRLQLISLFVVSFV